MRQHENHTNRLLKRLNDRDISVMEDLYHNYYGGLCNYAFRVLKDWALAQDIVSDAFVRFWEAEYKFQDIGRLKGTLYVIVHRGIGMHFRQLGRDELFLKGFETYSGSLEEPPDNEIVHSEVIRSIGELIRNLPQSQREVAEMMLKEDVSVQEMAARLGTSSQNVSKQKRRIFAKLKRWLDFLAVLIVILCI